MLSGSQTTTSPQRQSMPRLSEVLFRSPWFESIAVLPSNVRAVEAAQLFCMGLQPFVSICGPSGWGKSLLLDEVSSRIKTERGESSCVKLSALEFAENHRTNRELCAPLLLDNVQDVLEKQKLGQQLKLLLERRVKTGRPTLLSFTFERECGLRPLLPGYREWTVAPIAGPDPSERLLVVRHMAPREGLLLGDNLVRLLASKVRGNGGTIKGALQRLKMHQRTWIDPRATLKACGILNPFFADNSGWDLREAVLETAKSVLEIPHPQELAVYMLTQEAMLPEADVAHFFGIEPARVYAISSRMRLRLEHSATLSGLIATVTELAIDRLLYE